MFTVLYEDNTQNIMKESLTLFEEVVKNPIFKNTPIFVFLNKKDLFETLIRTQSLTKCFPEYTGDPGAMQPALEFIKSKFTKIMNDHVPGKKLHFSIIAARVRMDMKVAFMDVKTALRRLVSFNSILVVFVPNFCYKSHFKNASLSFAQFYDKNSIL